MGCGRFVYGTIPRMRAVTLARLHRGLPGLAFVAALLLAVVPTLGRLAKSAPAGEWMEMCTTLGAARVWVPMQDGQPVLRAADDVHAGHAVHAAFSGASAPTHDQHQERGDAGGHGAHGEDCPYCPLLGSLLLFALCWALLPAPHRRWAGVARDVAPARFRHPIGLGSRGPPGLLTFAVA